MTPQRHDRLLVAAILASFFGPPFMFSGVAVALPVMAADLDAGATSLGLVETLFLAGNLAFLLPAGRLADAAGRAALYRAGLIAFCLTSALVGALSWMPAILAVRFLQGVAAAVYAATGTALLTELVPPGRRGRAFGLSLGVAYAGLTLGPLLAGWLVQLFGWRAVFFAGAAIVLLGYGLVHARLPSGWRRPGRAVHMPSAALVVAAALCLVAGSATARTPWLGGGCVALGAALAFAFVRLQARLSRPLLDVGALLRNLALRRALLAQMLLYMNAFCSAFVLSVFMQITLSQPAPRAGMVLAVGTLVMAVVAPWAGALADRWPPQRLARLGIACIVVSAAQGVTLDADVSLPRVGALLVTQGLGFALFSSPNMKTVMDSVPAEEHGMASALGAKARALGMVLGMLLTAACVSLWFGNAPIAADPAALVSVVRAVFCALVVAALAALWASTGRGGLGGRIIGRA